MANNTSSITPFWQRLPQFFIYPLLPPGCFVVLGYVVLATLLSTTHIFFLALFSIVVHIAILRYAYEALTATAQGELKPPSLATGVLTGGYELPIKQWLVFIFVYFLIYSMAGSVGPHVALLLGVVFWLVLPANVIILAMSGSFFQSLNPMLLIGLVKRLGWSYLGLYGLLICLYIAWQNVLFWLVGQNFTTGLLALVYAFNAYYLIAMFHLMGYVIYQYHEQIGYEVDDEESSDEPTLGLYEEFMAQEDYQAAAGELRYYLQDNPDDSQLRLRLHRLLKLIGEPKELCLHGRKLITLLLKNRQTQQASEVLLDCLQADESFKPGHADEYKPLAEFLRLAGKSQLAIILLNGFHREHPESPLIPEFYLLAMQILIEDLNRPHQAAKILAYLQRRFADHAIAPQLQAYQKILTKASS